MKCVYSFIELEIKDNSLQINELLKYVEEKFSDVLFKEGVITKLDLIGKGKIQCHNLFY